MRGNAFLVGLGLCLAACSSSLPDPVETTAQPVSLPEGIAGTEESKVTELSVGMTEDEVGAVLGGYRRDITVEPLSCRSYPYDLEGEARLSHVYFRNGRVIGATDDHTIPCGLPG